MKYLELLNQSAEETAKTNNELINEEYSIAIQQEIFNCKKEIAGVTSSILRAKQSLNLDFVLIVSSQNKVDLLTRKYNQLLELQKELF
jgi:hypothetical protein